MKKDTLHQFLKLYVENNGQVMFRLHNNLVEHPPTIGWIVEVHQFQTPLDNEFPDINAIFNASEEAMRVGEDAYVMLDSNNVLSVGIRLFSRSIARSLHKAVSIDKNPGSRLVFDLKTNKWAREL